MSIHKSQGQTLHYVKVDLAKVFERGAVSFSEFHAPAVLNTVGPRPKLRCLVASIVVGGVTGPSLQSVKGELPQHPGDDVGGF